MLLMVSVQSLRKWHSTSFPLELCTTLSYRELMVRILLLFIFIFSNLVKLKRTARKHWHKSRGAGAEARSGRWTTSCLSALCGSASCEYEQCKHTHRHTTVVRRHRQKHVLMHPSSYSNDSKSQLAPPCFIFTYSDAATVWTPRVTADQPVAGF